MGVNNPGRTFANAKTVRPAQYDASTQVDGATNRRAPESEKMTKGVGAGSTFPQHANDSKRTDGGSASDAKNPYTGNDWHGKENGNRT